MNTTRKIGEFSLNLEDAFYGVDSVCFKLNNPYRYGFNGKEKENDISEGDLDFGARIYDSKLGRFYSTDRYAPKYPSLSPFNFANNNPIVYIDNDGDDIYIWYKVKDKNGKITQKPFIFNGKNEASAPKDAYVQSVLNAYKYNVENGGGDKLKEAATEPNIKIEITQSDDINGSSYVMDNNRDFVYWNANEALLTDEGDVLSPATLLEHEVDHALDGSKNYPEHLKRANTYDAKYQNKEEKRVETGSERKTGKANKEFNNSKQRSSHNGTEIIVDNSTSTKINIVKTFKHYLTKSNAGIDVKQSVKKIENLEKNK